MEHNDNMDYKQILRLIHQLPDEEIEKLAHTLQSEISSKKSTESLQELLLNAPTWSDDDWKQYQEARNHINQSRLA